MQVSFRSLPCRALLQLHYAACARHAAETDGCQPNMQPLVSKVPPGTKDHIFQLLLQIGVASAALTKLTKQEGASSLLTCLSPYLMVPQEWGHRPQCGATGEAAWVPDLSQSFSLYLWVKENKHLFFSSYGHLDFLLHAAVQTQQEMILINTNLRYFNKVGIIFSLKEKQNNSTQIHNMVQLTAYILQSGTCYKIQSTIKRKYPFGDHIKTIRSGVELQHSKLNNHLQSLHPI